MTDSIGILRRATDGDRQRERGEERSPDRRLHRSLLAEGV
jgi:hypothetical protein